MKKLIEKLLFICEEFQNEKEFNKRLLMVANSIKTEDIKKLFIILNENIEEPSNRKLSIDIYRKHQVSSWDGLFSGVIFKILFHLKEKSIPHLVEGLLGKNEQISQYSTHTLCKLAVEKIDQEHILKVIRRNLFRLDRLSLNFISQGLIEIKLNETVDSIYNSILSKIVHYEKDIFDVIDAYLVIHYWAKSNKIKAKEYLFYLRNVAKGEADKYNDPELLQDFFTPEYTKFMFESVKVNCAIFHNEIEFDEELEELIKYWKINSKFDEIRKRINAYLANK